MVEQLLHHRPADAARHSEMEGEGVVDAIEAFRCPITDEILLDPVVTGDGHTSRYSRAAIEQWFREHKTSALVETPCCVRTL